MRYFLFFFGSLFFLKGFLDLGVFLFFLLGFCAGAAVFHPGGLMVFEYFFFSFPFFFFPSGLIVGVLGFLVRCYSLAFVFIFRGSLFLSLILSPLSQAVSSPFFIIIHPLPRLGISFAV